MTSRRKQTDSRAYELAIGCDHAHVLLITLGSYS